MESNRYRCPWIAFTCAAMVCSSVASATTLEEAIRNKDYEWIRQLLKSSPSLVNTQEFFRCGYGQPIHLAALEGSAEIVQIFLDYKADVNARDNRGSTPLHIAAEFGHAEVAKLLLIKNANIDAQDTSSGRTPLHVAALHGRAVMAELLLKNGATVDAKAKNGNTALELAAFNNYPDVVEVLRRHDAGNWDWIRDAAETHRAARTNDIVRLRALLKLNPKLVGARSYDGTTPLHTAAIAGSVEAAQVLLASGADVNATHSFGSTPLHFAMSQKNNGVVELLLSQKPNVNAKDKSGRTPLFEAISWGRRYYVAILLKHGADATLQDDSGNTPLHLAAERGVIGVGTILLEHGAEINALDKGHGTPLHSAARGRSEHSFGGFCSVQDTFAWLLAHGSDASMKDTLGHTALDVAAMFQSKQTVDRLNQQVASH